MLFFLCGRLETPLSAEFAPGIQSFSLAKEGGGLLRGGPRGTKGDTDEASNGRLANAADAESALNAVQFLLISGQE